MATVAEVAAWMHAEFERAGTLALAGAVAGTRARFGPQFVAGGRIRKDVLSAFRRLEPTGRVWAGSTRAGRRRAPQDPPLQGPVLGR